MTKFVSVREAKALLSEKLKESQGERIVITRHGRPVSMLVGVEAYDIDDIYFVANPEFWAMIEARRSKSSKARRTSHKEVRRRFATPRSRARIDRR